MEEKNEQPDDEIKQIQKPKKPRSEKQVESFKMARKKQGENTKS